MGRRVKNLSGSHGFGFQNGKRVSSSSGGFLKNLNQLISKCKNNCQTIVGASDEPRNYVNLFGNLQHCIRCQVFIIWIICATARNAHIFKWTRSNLVRPSSLKFLYKIMEWIRFYLSKQNISLLQQRVFILTCSPAFNKSKQNSYLRSSSSSQFNFGLNHELDAINLFNV